MARYRIMLINGEYFPQHRVLWFWFSYKQLHQGGGSSAMQFHCLDEAVEYVHQHIEHVQKAFEKKTKAVAVWSHD